MGKSANDYLESLFTGIDTIIDKRFETLAYDKTIVCTVVDHSKSKNGEYKVSTGDVIYTAYSDTNKYSSGDQVRVSIPMSDYTQKKFIVGKYTTDNDSTPITYMSPLDTVLSISGNLVSNIATGIMANGEDTEKIIWNKSFVDDPEFIAMQNNNIYNTIILKAEFKTLFNNYDLVDGNYGVRLDFLICPSANSKVNIRRYVELDSSEMFGNPYGFSIYSQQAKVIKLDTLGIVKGLELTLYQKNNFVDRTRGAIVPVGKADDILIRNIELGFGCDLGSLEDNTLQIYTENNLDYKYSEHDDTTNLKKMGLLWLNKDDNGQYVGFSDGIYDADYDELEYIELSKGTTRLLNQKGRTGVPTTKTGLTLAANIEEAVPLIESAIKVADSDLTQLLQDFSLKVEDVAAYANNINTVIDKIGESTARLYDLLDKENGVGLVQSYEKILNYTYEIQNEIKTKKDGKELSHTEAWNPAWLGEPSQDGNTYHGYGKLIAWEFATILNLIKNLLKTSSGGGFEKIDKEYSGLKSVYDSYKKRIGRHLVIMVGYLGKKFGPTHNKAFNIDFQKEYGDHTKDFPAGVIPKLSTNAEESSDYEKLGKLGRKNDADVTKESLKVYKEPDYSEYDNKYCIYWFRYEKDYETPETEQILPSGWRRLKPEEFFKQINLTSSKYKKNKYYTYDETKKKFELCTGAFNSSTTYYRRNPKCFVNEKDGVNVGLSSQYKDSNGNAIKNSEGKPVHAPKPDLGIGFLNMYMQNDLEEEKYKAVLFYNHNMYTSNELVFTNKDVIPDKATLDSGDILIFEHLDKSTPSYQSYDITYHLMNRSDEHLNRQIRCHYDGLLAKDNALVGGQIYWYIPGSSTMLTFDKEDLESKDFVLDDKRSERGWQELKKEDFEREGKVYESDTYYKLKNGKYELWTEAAVDDNSCSVPIEFSDDPNDEGHYYEKTYKNYCFYKTVLAKEIEPPPADAREWEKWDYTNGSDNKIDNRDFWYKIKPIYSDSATENTIKCVFIKDKKTDEISGEEIFNFGIKGTSGTKYTLTVENRTSQNVATSDEGLKLKCAITDCDNEVLSFTEVVNDFSVGWQGYKQLSGDEATTAGQNYSESQVGATFNTPKGCYGILKLTGKIDLVGTELESEENQEGKKRTIDLTVYHDVPYSTGDYVLDGPTQIIYNGLGTIDDNSLYNNPYRLKAKKNISVEVSASYKNASEFNKDTRTKYIWKNSKYEKIESYDKNITEYFVKVDYKAGDIINPVEWNIVYYKNDDNGEWVDLSTSKTKKPGDDGYYPSEAEYCAAYMPTIEGNNLKPAPLYMSDLNCQAVIIAKVGKKIKYRQPLIIFQNKYGSTMLNNWDGTFEIDEKNGTIMGTMFGAGKKTSNNTFEGVLMGDVATGAGITQGFDTKTAPLGLSNHTGIGIYGFNDGAQSFGLNVDGSAFFGKSGKGRIIFNGNYGVIASSNWFTGIDTYDANGDLQENKGKINPDGSLVSSNAGMCINLESGHIDAYNFKITSKNIYLNSTPTENDSYNGNNPYYFRIGSDGTSFMGQIDQQRTNGYIGLTTSGDLDIRVNKLTITEQLGGENLLRQSSPSQNALQYVVPTSADITAFNKKVSDNKLTIQNKKIGDKYYKIGSDGTYYYEMNSTYRTYKYTLDGNGNYLYERDANTKALKYYWNTNSQLQHPSYCQWTPNTKSKITGNQSSDNKRYVGITHIDSSDKPNSYIMTQTVEDLMDNTEYTLSGWVQVTSVSGDFTATLKESGTNTQLKKTKLSLNTGIVKASDLDPNGWVYFEKNVKLPADKTAIDVQFSYAKPFRIYHAKLEQGNTATEWCLSEWDVDNNIETTTDNFSQYLSQDEIFNKLATNPQTGQLMNGIWLQPNSLSGTTELYICATYISTGILRSNNFDGSVSYDPTKTNRSEQYSVSGGTEGMYINLNEGFIWAKEFTLTAGKNNGVIEINSDPGGNGNYFYIGTSSDYIKFFEETKNNKVSKYMEIKATNFDLSVDGSAGDIHITSNQSENPLSIGENFSVDWEGNITATGADITGKITADEITANTKGTIGGWTIGQNTISNGDMKLTSAADGNGSLTAGSASIGSDGILKATSAVLTSLTVNKSLYVAKDDGDGILTVEGDTTLKGDTTIEGDLNLHIDRFLIDGVSGYSTDGNDSIEIDAPRSGYNYYLTVKHGIITSITREYTAGNAVLDWVDKNQDKLQEIIESFTGQQ